MSRLLSRFESLRTAGRKALIPFVTAGDPTPGSTPELMHRMVASGADILELGVPFSDPMADGPVIQRASERALENGVGLRETLDVVSRFRERDGETPVVLMGYLNPVECTGYARFAAEAEEAGVDGVLTVDLPPEEAEGLTGELRAKGLDPIFLLAPTSTEERIGRICAQASGFVYYVSLKGVTGSSRLDVEDVAAKLAPIRAATGLPVGVGFGIHDAASAAEIAQVADAVVVGSALVKRIEASLDSPESGCQEICALLSEMRQAMDVES